LLNIYQLARSGKLKLFSDTVSCPKSGNIQLIIYWFLRSGQRSIWLQEEFATF
jgi:hypothetical protein